jgi:cell division protein FtsW
VKIPWYFYAIIGVGILVLGIWFVLNADRFLEGYASARIGIWLKLLTGEELTNDEMSGSGWQSMQSLYAIGSGGLLGLGPGDSRQKHLFLPEPQNDFIFSVFCEEMGFVGAVLVLVLFALLVWRGFIIGMRSPDKFGCMLAIGLTLQIGLQVAINVAVVSNLMPNTGISLPFFSYGGTSILMLMLQMGVVLSISRQARMEKA